MEQENGDQNTEQLEKLCAGRQGAYITPNDSDNDHEHDNDTVTGSKTCGH